MRHSIWAFLFFALGSCTETPATQVLVSVRVEPEVAAVARSFTVTVSGGASAGVLEQRLESTADTLDGIGPLFVLTPLHGDSTRVFRVNVTAFDASGGTGGAGSPIAATALLSGYIPHETRAYTLTLYDACAGQVCDPSEACYDSRGCVDAFVPSEDLVPVDPNTFGQDAGADSPARFDGGPTFDGGPGFDGGPPYDGGPGFDGGPRSDGGPTSDGAPGDADLRDAGRDALADARVVVRDGGAPLDVGFDAPPFDAGFDAPPFDAGFDVGGFDGGGSDAFSGDTAIMDANTSCPDAGMVCMTGSRSCEVWRVVCTGSVGNCERMGVQPAGTECGIAEPCNAQPTCDGVSPMCPSMSVECPPLRECCLATNTCELRINCDF